MSSLTSKGSTKAWRNTRRVVLARDGYRCQLCSVALTTHDPRARTHATVDHVVGRAEWTGPGDVDDPANLRAACLGCNLGRSSEQRAAARQRRAGGHRLGASRDW